MTAEFMSPNFPDFPKETDVGITVGKHPDVQIFPAHKFLLDNMPYFAKLYNQDNENNVLSITLPDISPKIFEIIYKFLYTRNLGVNKLKTLDIVEILITADKLGFRDIVIQLQDFLVEKKTHWMEHHFIYIQQISFGHDFNKLQEFCKDFITRYPESIFRLPEFNEIPEEILISLIKRDDLLLEEAVIWEHVLKWGLARNPDLPEDLKTWSEENFNNLSNTLSECLKYIRFSHLTSQQFYEKAHQIIFRFDPVFHDHLLKFYLVPNTEQLYPPRQSDINGSEIINDPHSFSQIFSHLSKVINNDMMYSRDLDYSYSSYSSRSYYNPYELKLLLRGSRHGFTPKVFHELCDKKPNTVTIIKVKGKDEILGGYNPDVWESKNGYGCCKSFIFTLRNNFEKLSISLVDYNERALNYGINYGPSFGLSDLVISGSNFKYDGTCYCKMDDYKLHIRNTENIFSIEDYEVFQVIKKN